MQTGAFVKIKSEAKTSTRIGVTASSKLARDQRDDIWGEDERSCSKGRAVARRKVSDLSIASCSPWSTGRDEGGENGIHGRHEQGWEEQSLLEEAVGDAVDAHVLDGLQQRQKHRVDLEMDDPERREEPNGQRRRAAPRAAGGSLAEAE